MNFNISDLNTYNSKSIMDKYSIVASLGKVSTIGGFRKNETFFDENVGIVASILRVQSGALNLTTVDEKIFSFGRIGETVGRKYFVLNISFLGDLVYNDKYKYGNVISLDISIFELIAILRLKYINNITIPKDKDNISSKEFEDRIIVKLVNSLKNKYIISHDPYEIINEFDLIFVINDLTWSNFVYILNSFGITVFGGNSTHRHLLSTVHSNLTTFITLNFGFRFLNEIIYNGFKKYEAIDKKFKKIEAKFMINLEHNESLLLAVIEDLKNKYGDLSTGIENHNVEFNDILYVNLNILVKYFNKLYHTIETLDIRVSNAKINLNNLRLNRNDQISHYKKVILEIKESLKQIESLKQTYYLDLQNFIKLNVVKNINFYNGSCNIEPKIKLNIDEDCFVIDSDEFNKLYDSYFTDTEENNSNSNSNYKSNSNGLSVKLRDKTLGDRKFSTSSIHSNKKTKQLVDPIPLLTENTPFMEYLEQEIQLAKFDPKSSQINIETKWLHNILNSLEQETENTEKPEKIKVQYLQNKILKLALKTFELKSKQMVKKFPNLHSDLKSRHVLIAYGLLDTYVDYLGFTALVFRVSEEILKDIYMSYFKNNKNTLSPRWQGMGVYNFNSFKLSLGITSIDKFKLGLFFIEIFLNKPTPLYIRSYKSGEIEDNNEISDEVMSILIRNTEFLDKNPTKKIISPYSLPMVAEPLNWSDTEFGGFYSNKKLEESIITGKVESHKMENKAILYNSINKLNKTRFKINSNLLEYLLNDGKVILNRYFSLLKNQSDFMQNITSLKLAKIYNMLSSPLYITTKADWRGRIYTLSFYLTYQGNELSLALLNLYDGQTLTKEGLDYLYIYGANIYNEKGMSKESLVNRIHWVKSNLDKIISLNLEFILKAESPILFTAFCLVIREYQKNPEVKIFLPVFLDATCSGIQHLSALVLDANTGNYVNLIPQETTSKVNDIYTEMLEPINKSLNFLGETDMQYKKFEDIKLTRKNIKANIMTQVYNVSVMGLKDQLANSFEKIEIEVVPKTEKNKTETVITDIGNNTNKNGEENLAKNLTKNKNKLLKKTKTFEYLVPSKYGGFIRLNNSEVLKMAQIIDNEIFKKFPSLEKIFKYFIDIARFCLNCNVPLTWFTPAGVQITQLYNKTITKKASIVLGSKTKSVVFRELTESSDRRKQVQAIIPNIVHSLDSAHLMLILEKAHKFGIIDVLTIHDCFGTHPNDMENLKKLIILEFVKIYTDIDFLSKFHNRVIQSIEDHGMKIQTDDSGNYFVIPRRSKKFHIPNLPIKGNLKLELALNSKYFIT